MAESVYEYGGGLYVNLTNRCPCKCTFCIRSQADGLGSATNLWLQRDPDADTVIRELEAFHPENYPEVIFCGYGEPLCALDSLIQVSGYVKNQLGKHVRVNTNGLGELIAGKPILPLLEGAVDAFSVSLNAPDEKSYNELCKPTLPGAYEAMLKFAKQAQQRFQVQFSVVDVISAEQIEACRNIAEDMGISLRIRHFSRYSNLI